MKMEVMLIENGFHRRAFYFFREITFKQSDDGQLELTNGLDKLGFLFDFYRNVVTPMDTLDDVTTTLAQFAKSSQPPASSKDCLTVLGMRVCEPQDALGGWSHFTPTLMVHGVDRTYTLFALWVIEGGLNTGDCQYPSDYFGCWQNGSDCMRIRIESMRSLRIEIMMGPGGKNHFIALPKVGFIFSRHYFWIDLESGESPENKLHSLETGSSVALHGNLRDIANMLKSEFNFGGLSVRILGGSLLRNQIDLIGIHLEEVGVNWLQHVQRQGVVVGENTRAFFLSSNATGGPSLEQALVSSKETSQIVEPPLLSSDKTSQILEQPLLSSQTSAGVQQPENKTEAVAMVVAGMLCMLSLLLL